MERQDVLMEKKLLSEEVIEDLKDYALNPHGFVLLVGKNGRGKSYTAMKVYEKVTPYKLPAFDHDRAWFINQADLNLLFAEINDKWGHARSLLEQAYKTQLLILDDLGSRIPSPAFMDFLYAVIDRRWNERHKKGTIITTNLDSTRLRKDLGDAIFSRIASGRNYVFNGEDRRFNEIGF
jgi:DNA replication protein DnaC